VRGAFRLTGWVIPAACNNRYEYMKAEYDIVVIGSGLAGLTGANRLARCGYSVLLLEHHNKLGGLATWFSRKGGHIFDVSLHGFPVGMIKTCRKYWSPEIAQSIVQLKEIRFDNPQFSLSTTFDTEDFTRILKERFGITQEAVSGFFHAVQKMDFFDDQTMTARELFEKFFPGRDDVMRLLMEPITYANGSDLDDPALTYGIVFSNFMSKGVFTFQGGTDQLIRKMQAELEKNGVDIGLNCLVEKILVKDQKVAAVSVNGQTIRCKAVLSNANLLSTIHDLVGDAHFPEGFLEGARQVRVNNSSCQVYMGIRKGERIDYVGDLLFTSQASRFDPKELRGRHTTSRTFSFYYPSIRPGSDRFTIVASTNALYDDWASLSPDEYKASKRELIDVTIRCLEKYLPGIGEKIDFTEAATPRTFQRYALHVKGASFGTKFEGLKISMDLPKNIGGLFHTGSVGIIMSGWLGAANYGVIAAHDVDRYMSSQKAGVNGQGAAVGAQ
jgi:phytoene dehydrogenase-like protein